MGVALGLVVGWMLWGRMVEYLQHATDVESTKFHTRVADLSNEVKFRAAEISRMQSDLGHALSDEAALRAELGIVRFDQRFEHAPRHDGSHLGQEYVALRALLLCSEVERRKTQLVRHPQLHRINDTSVPCSKG